MSSQDRRAAIVQAAVGLFAERGFRGTTTRELAAAVGVTEPVLYHHFKTKRDLYSAIIEGKAREGARKFAALLRPYMEACDDRGFFGNLAEHILQRYSEDPAFVRLLLFSALEGHELAEMFYRRRVSGFYKKLVTAYIQQRIKQGAFRRMDPMVAARAFAGMVHHHALLGVLFHDISVKVEQKKFAEDIVNIFLQGMCRERSGAK